MAHLLELKDLSKYYHTGNVIALGLRKVSLTLNKGEFVAVVGESGSGKSTLLNVISGMDTYEEGELLFDGEETSGFTQDDWGEYRKNNISFIFQDYNLIDSYTVLQNVELALFDSIPDKKVRRAKALQLIDEVELTSHIKHRCTKLSGGQKQRVAIARALAKDAPIIIADEPTGNLDEGTGKSIINLLQRVSRHKLLVMVTHNFDDVAEVATRKIRLFDGSVAEDRVIRNISKEESTVNIPQEDKIYSLNEKPQSTVNNFKSRIKDKFIKIKKEVGTLFHIAGNNLIATPKKSIFLFTTAFISVALLLIYFLGTAYSILPSPETNSNGDRKDTAIVLLEDGRNMTEADRTAIKSISGVETAMLYYGVCGAYAEADYQAEIYEGSAYASFSLLNAASCNKKVIEYGRKPEALNEILLGFSSYNKPNTDMIGKTVEFTFNNYSYYFGSYTVKRDMVITGYTSSTSAYVTTETMESLSHDAALEAVKNVELYLYGDFEYSPISFLSLYTDQDISMGEAYLIYNPADMDDENEFYNLYSSVNSEPENDVYFSGMNINFPINVTLVTPTSNPALYQKYYVDRAVLAISTQDFRYSTDLNSTNSIALILDESYNVNLTIERLKGEGYKVLYMYGAYDDIYKKIDIIGGLISAAFGGIIFIMLSVLLLSEIIRKVMAGRLKDYNILRTLGYRSRAVNSISYIEFGLINAIAFVSLLFIIITTYTIAIAVGDYRTINLVQMLLPYGAFHITAITLYAVTFVILMTQALLIIKRFNKRIFKLSVKSASVKHQ
jgi:ABC-type lipoprotein export system ATPase subunit